MSHDGLYEKEHDRISEKQEKERRKKAQKLREEIIDKLFPELVCESGGPMYIAGKVLDVLFKEGYLNDGT